MRRFLVCCVFLCLAIAIKANVYRYVDGYGMTFSWQKYGMSAVYYDGEEPMIFYVKDIQEDSRITTWTSGAGWYLALNESYSATSPYMKTYQREQETALSVTYRGEVQTGNDNTEHLTAYDYMTSKVVVADNTLYYPFVHHGCMLRIVYSQPSTTTKCSLILKLKEKRFTTDAKMNVVSQVLTPVNSTDSMKLDIENLELANGEDVIAYMMMYPVDLTNDTIAIKVVDNSQTIWERKVTGTKFVSGKLYQIDASSEMDSNVSDVGGQVEENVFPNLPVSSAVYPVAYTHDFVLANVGGEELKVLGTPRGDVNFDGKVTMADANLVVNMFLSNNVGFSEKTQKAADVNEDGVVTMSDANEIVNIFLGK